MIAPTCFTWSSGNWKIQFFAANNRKKVVSKLVNAKFIMKNMRRRMPSPLTPANIKETVFNAIRARCPKGVSLTIKEQHGATPYVVIPPDRSNTPKDQSPALAKCFRAVDKAATEVFGKPPIYLREGGSVGLLADLKEVLGLDAVMMGLFLPEDNLHAPNESFHLGVMKRGIETSERVLATLANG